MILTTHILVSTAVARHVARGNPILAFFWGWLSHYLMDAIPHVDYNINSMGQEGGIRRTTLKQKFSDYGRVGGEALVGSLISFWVIYPQNWYQLIYWMCIVAGGVLPDFLHYLSDIVGLKTPKFLSNFHENIHTKIKLRYSHPFWGGVSQFLICAIAIYFAR